jgi:hypothetical protein
MVTGVILTASLALLTPIKDNAVKFFGVTKELEKVNQQMNVISEQINNIEIPKDTIIYAQLDSISSELQLIKRQNRVTNLKMDVLKQELGEKIEQRFTDIESASNSRQTLKITAKRVND